VSELIDQAAKTGDEALVLMSELTERLFYGRDFSDDGTSPFGAVLTVAAYQVIDEEGGGLRPVATAAFTQNFTLEWARPALIAKLNQIVEDLEQLEATSKQVPT
jgi:hypothetical protein